MDHGDRRSGAHAHGAAPRPWRGSGGGGAAPPPPKVYRVEPRDFRELVQRLTGAGAPAAPGPVALAAQAQAQQRVAVAPATVAVEGRRAEAAAAAAEQFDYAAWFSAPLFSPAYGAPPGFNGHPGSSGPLL
ncbi:hypothetical protein U9M48_010159 [Paspalum notatum var. saurae]|uniref:VQ domain-containing protein n=1 Tax=Paspalum notatum var. saurae TaxID=547442 RepID=A0AAQ3WFV0_PASNO